MALYNKVRPTKFENVLGQDNAIRILKDGLIKKKGEYPQVNIFIGPHGTGKTTCAGILSKVLNCENPVDGEPCCVCESCRSIQAHTSPSVIELDAASNNGVDDARSIIEQTKFVPVGKKKVFILDEVQMLSTAAWNAYLKCFEEPPKDVFFILCTTEALKVSVTAKSRCQEVYFKPISAEVIEEHLYNLCRKEGIDIAPDALEMIARKADGHMRDAISDLEKYSVYDYIDTELILNDTGESSEDIVSGILGAVLTGDGGKALEILSGENQRGKSVKRLVGVLCEMLSDVCHYLCGYHALKGRSESYALKVQELAGVTTQAKAAEVLESLIKAYPVFSVPQASFYLDAVLTHMVTRESLLCRMEADIQELKESKGDGNILSFPVTQNHRGAGEEPAFSISDEEIEKLADDFTAACGRGMKEETPQKEAEECVTTEDSGHFEESLQEEQPLAPLKDAGQDADIPETAPEAEDLGAEEVEWQYCEMSEDNPFADQYVEQPVAQSLPEEEVMPTVKPSDMVSEAAGTAVESSKEEEEPSASAESAMVKGEVISYEEMMKGILPKAASDKPHEEDPETDHAPADLKEEDFGFDDLSFFMSGGLARC